MSSDVKIPDWAHPRSSMSRTDLYARIDELEAIIFAFPDALLAAERRGRRQALDEASNVAFDEMFNAVDAIRARKLQTAIRSLGEQE